MKKIIAVLLVIIGFYPLSAQDSLKPNNYQIFYYPSGQKSSEGTLLNGKPDGYWISYNENGTIASEGNRKNFELDSTWIFYNKNGDKELEINYLQGKKMGKRIRYFESEYIIDFWYNDSLLSPTNTYFFNGNIKKITPIENEKPHGLEKIFNEEGRIIAVVNYYQGLMTRREQINRIDQFGFRQGAWKTFWDNGNLKEEGYFINNKKNGFFKYYDEKGNFLSVEKWENDKLIEDAPETKILEMKTAYHNNGKPSIKATYYKGKPEGIRREFDTAGKVIKGCVYENGFKRYEGITDLNGLRQGFWIEFYETGELRSKGTYKNSSPIGIWNFYFPNQTIEIEGNYNKKGKKEGEWTWYYPDGNIVIQENWSDGDLDGPYVEYDDKGKELVKGNYLEGTEDGKWYYRNNQTVETGEYYDGMRTGNWKTWFANGQLAFDIDYEQDLYNGKFIAYWENGYTKISGRYENGEAIGIWEKYDENGVLYLTTTYKNGKEIQWNNYNFENKKEK